MSLDESKVSTPLEGADKEIANAARAKDTKVKDTKVKDTKVKAKKVKDTKVKDTNTNYNSSRRVVGTDIITKRKEKQQNSNLWTYVEIINSKLSTNIIENNTIIIEINWAINAHIISQLVDTFSNVGWTIEVTETSNLTTFKFIT